MKYNLLPYNRTKPPRSYQTSSPAKEKVGFITFGAGSNRYRNQAIALSQEAQYTSWFDRVICITDEPDNKVFNNLLKLHYDFICRHKKGFGLWLWKPIIIQHAMIQNNEIDVWLYADSGCEISLLGEKRFFYYLNFSIKTGGVFFSIPFCERSWTKHSLLNRLNVKEKDKDSNQLQATCFIIRNQENIRELIENWKSVSIEDSYTYLLDPKKHEYYDDKYIEHRQDQSILSILVKQGNFSVLEWEDRFDRSLYIPNSWIFLYPIHARRAKYIRITTRLSQISTYSLCQSNYNLPNNTFMANVSILRRLTNIYVAMRKLINIARKIYIERRNG